MPDSGPSGRPCSDGEKRPSWSRSPDCPDATECGTASRSRPQVSIIIPTRDLSALLETCLKSIFEKTAYDHFEVIVVDNDSREPETLDLFRRWKEKEPSRFRVAPLPIPFNFPALINEGVRNAAGDLVLLLNNDIEVVSEEWLSEMAAQAMRPRIGAVGVKLLYPDDTVQHAGVVLGIGGSRRP